MLSATSRSLSRQTTCSLSLPSLLLASSTSSINFATRSCDAYHQDQGTNLSDFERSNRSGQNAVFSFKRQERIGLTSLVALLRLHALVDLLESFETKR
eukprot:764962-Hanusia_phi.AAC.2